MAEEIAAQDAYARQTEADVVEVTDDGIVLDRTVFYPRGGGQPGDQGVISWPGGKVRVETDGKRISVKTHEDGSISFSTVEGGEYTLLKL